MKFVTSKQIHSRGALSIAHNLESTDEKVVSCGVDGVIGVWDKGALSSDGSPKIREISDRTHSCCALYDNQVYAGFTQTDLSTGVEKQVVGSFGIDEEDAVKTIMSFSLDVTSVKVSKDWVIAGSSDFSVKRAERADDDMSAGYNRYELNAQVLDIQIHPSEKVFAVSSCDGFVSLFDGDDTEPVYSHKLFTPIRDLDDSFPRILMAWSVDGKFLFIPCKGMIKVMSKKGDKWNIEREFKHDDEKEDDFSVVTTSLCGKFVAASTMASLVHIWEIESGLLVSTADYGSERAGRITGLAYLGEKSKKLIVADSHGNIATLEETGPPKEKKQEKKANVFMDDEAMQEDSFNANDKEDEEDDDDEILVSKNKKFIVEDDEMDEDTRMSSSIAAIKKKYGYDDDGERMDEAEGNSFDEDPFSNIDAHPGSLMKKMEKNDKIAPVRVVEKYSPPTPPPYFSSASSPRNITQRYIKWNGFGTIRVLESEDGESSLEIRFHDSSVHSEMLLSNTDLSYSMGDLNDKVIALATRLKGASKHLYVKLLNSWDSNDDHWEIQLTKGEFPDDVVVSSEFVALLCENRNIRVFTHAGTQRHVITHPTPILTLSSFSDRLAVVSIGGGPLFFSHKDETNYEFPLILNEYRLGAISQWWSSTAMAGPSSSSIRDQPLALSKGTELTWIGYTNRGRIVAQGSDSIIRLLVSPPYSPSFWTPIFDGREALTSPSDFIWPVSVVEKPVTQLRYVYCRGVKYPMATLKLNPIIANWSLPLCNKASDKSCLEEELFLNELAMSAANETEIKDLSSNHLKTIIKLFSLAIKGDRESRAVEMANLTSSSKGVQLLVNWAAKQRRNALVEKVSEVGRRKAEEEDETLNRQLGYGGWEEKEKMEDRGNRVVAKKVALRRSIAASSANKYRIEEEKDESIQSVEEPASEIGSQGVFNLDSSISIPARNPFKRSVDESVADTSSTSVFDDLDSPGPMRKKLRETQNTVSAPITQKQAKLSFGSNKKSSGYDLWLLENEERLKGDFIGDEEDFIKYCTQAYRMLTGTERKEWRRKAES